MSDQSACAHIRVVWCQKYDPSHLIVGWWACPECLLQFVPASTAEARIQSLEAEIGTAQSGYLMKAQGYGQKSAALTEVLKQAHAALLKSLDEPCEGCEHETCAAQRAISKALGD